MSELIGASINKKDAKKQKKKLAKLWEDADYHVWSVETKIEILAVKLERKIINFEKIKNPSEKKRKRKLANIQKYKNKMKLLKKKQRKLNRKRNSIHNEYRVAASIYSEAERVYREISGLRLEV